MLLAWLMFSWGNFRGAWRALTFRIQAIMSHCAARNCVYGVGAFAR
ncbi:MAG: hypothetical protein NZ482_09280 [Gloeomargarita sp. SKYG98]|nr:hypothetical protein [Gloeomargarita sp. SKYG98]